MTALAGTAAAQPACAASASSTCRWAATSRAGLRRAEGRSTELSPTLSSLEPVKQHVTAISNLELQNAYPGTHATSNSAFLSAAKAKQTESTDYYLGTTVDQIAAQQIGQRDAVAVAGAVDGPARVVGQCDNGYACVYQNNLSWSSPTTPLPAEAHPRIVFESLFGEGGSTADRRAALRKRASLLDSVTDEIARLQNAARPGGSRPGQPVSGDGPRGRAAHSERPRPTPADNPLPDLDRPVGVPASYADHARLMFDLQVLALQGDVTRVITFQLARETSKRTYPEIGVSDPHHPLTHHGNDPDKIAKMAKINRVPRVALRRVPREAEGHAGRRRLAAGPLRSTCTAAAWAIRTCTTTRTCRSSSPGARPASMKGGRHIRYAEPTPLANLHLTLLDKVGVRLDSFADSQGKVDELFEPLSV